MGMNHDFYWLFSSFWWLLFPLGWAIGQLLKSWMRHKRAQAALEVIQSYASQGKEPPPELIAVLRQPEQAEERAQARKNYQHYGWIPIFLFGALALGFAMMAVFPFEGLRGKSVALIFVAIIMTGLCLGNLVAMQARKNQDRIPPP